MKERSQQLLSRVEENIDYCTLPNNFVFSPFKSILSGDFGGKNVGPPQSA